jgi:hypothetical protein
VHAFAEVGSLPAELCEADSDGDGKTNGEELGDPCCVWKPTSLPTVGKDYRISHPGHAEDVTDSPGPSAAECQALVNNQGAAAAFNETEWVDSLYNPGEDRTNLTFRYASATKSFSGDSVWDIAVFSSTNFESICTTDQGIFRRRRANLSLSAGMLMTLLNTICMQGTGAHPAAE